MAFISYLLIMAKCLAVFAQVRHSLPPVASLGFPTDNPFNITACLTPTSQSCSTTFATQKIILSPVTVTTIKTIIDPATKPITKTITSTIVFTSTTSLATQHALVTTTETYRFIDYELALITVAYSTSTLFDRIYVTVTQSVTQHATQALTRTVTYSVASTVTSFVNGGIIAQTTTRRVAPSASSTITEYHIETVTSPVISVVTDSLIETVTAKYTSIETNSSTVMSLTIQSSHPLPTTTILQAVYVIATDQSTITLAITTTLSSSGPITTTTSNNTLIETETETTTVTSTAYMPPPSDEGSTGGPERRRWSQEARAIDRRATLISNSTNENSTVPSPRIACPLPHWRDCVRTSTITQIFGKPTVCVHNLDRAS